jgi:hypothetical protein
MDIEQARVVGQRTGLTRNAVVAMALDDYLRRHEQLIAQTTGEDGRAQLYSV